VNPFENAQNKTQQTQTHAYNKSKTVEPQLLDLNENVNILIILFGN